MTGFENDLTELDTKVALADMLKPLKIKNFIYDDPYGAFDWKTKTYPVNRGTGNDQILTYDQFLACAKPLTRKVQNMLILLQSLQQQFKELYGKVLAGGSPCY